MTLANKQVTAARNLLTRPNADAKQILIEAASKLLELWNNGIVKDNEKNEKGFNRSIFGGILEGASNTEDVTRMQTERIGKVKTDTNPTPTDRAGILAILGDIGTAAFDCNPTKTGDKDKAYCKIRDTILSKHVSDLTERNCYKSDFIPLALSTRGGSAIAPMKKGDKANNKPAERGMVFDDGKLRLLPRSGLLTDKTDSSGFQASWPWQTIPKNYMDNCKEPWAGHYSGSILEVLFMLDFFTKASNTLGRDHPMRSWQPAQYSSHAKLATPACKTLFNDVNKIPHHKNENKWRVCKGALAGAFLISIGYHSAIEVKPTIWAFLGRTAPKIFTNDSPTGDCDTSATNDMVRLMESCTQA